VRVIVVQDEETGAKKLGFEFLEGPVTPKPEKLPQAKPKRRPGSRRKPPGPRGGDDRPTNPRGSVPKVPLVKV
jgi:ATP-dependent Clp protease ATP-binding subunit ClpA